MKATTSKKTNEIWMYELEPANAIIGAILMSLFILFFLLFAIQNDMALSKDHYLFFVLIVSLIALLITKKKVLEINRRDKIINKYSKVLFFKKNNIQPITDCDSITILPKTETLEEGYLGIVYSLVLLSPTASIEIVSFDDKEEAKRHLHELSVFLSLGAENKPARLS